MTNQSSSIAKKNAVEDFLYYVKLVTVDCRQAESGAIRIVDILGTYTSLSTAQAAAHACLASKGYDVADFSIYEDKNRSSTWTHDDSMFVFAKTPTGRQFEVFLDTKANFNNLTGNAEGFVEGPLYHLLQTKIDYNNSFGAVQTTEVEGTYRLRRDAYYAAYEILLDEEDGITMKSFADYDEKFERKEEDWPYGKDTLVHAVASTGETYLVQLKAQLGMKATTQ